MSSVVVTSRTPARSVTDVEKALGDVQALVLRTPAPESVRHLLITFANSTSATPCSAVETLRAELHWGCHPTGVEAALGFTWRGLETLCVPDKVLGIMRRLAPAFAAGAAVRSATHLGDIGASAARHWDQGFAQNTLHAVLTVHGSPGDCDRFVEQYENWFRQTGLGFTSRLAGNSLSAPSSGALSGVGRWVHFGYRDGITQPVIDVAPLRAVAQRSDAVASLHKPGELLLGRTRDVGDNPWCLAMLPQEIRDFFHDSSFGVLRMIEQDAQSFETALKRWARVWNANGGSRFSEEKVIRFIRAKLCGRWPEGPIVQPLDAPDTDITRRDFSTNFLEDPHGSGCPFASHVRRMQGHVGGAALARPRVLFRRSLPYGEWWRDGEQTPKERGLLGLFFCSSIEEQFEHLLGQWADRMPLGLADGSLVKDPFVGAHDDPAAGFMLRDEHGVPLKLWGFERFVRTRGTTYLFYPSWRAFEPLIDGRKWVAEVEPWLTT